MLDSDAEPVKLAVRVWLGVAAPDGLSVWLREVVRLPDCVSDGLWEMDGVTLCDEVRDRLGVWVVLDERDPVGDCVWLSEKACVFDGVSVVLELCVQLELPD